MTDTVATTNVPKAWSPASDTDTITCAHCDTQSRDGIQIEVVGFDLEDATVTVTTVSGASKVVAAPDGSGEIALFGAGFKGILSVQITGIPADSYTVTFSQ